VTYKNQEILLREEMKTLEHVFDQKQFRILELEEQLEKRKE
jgi:hypothetical protein